MLYQGRRPVEIMICEWTTSLCTELQTIRGESAFLSFYESLVALITLHLWCGPEGHQQVALIGDNTAALTVAVSQRGKGDLGKVCREVALRQARGGLVIAVGHLPTKHTVLADALSRLSSPDPPRFPSQLRGLPCRAMPCLGDLFRIEPPAGA